MPSAMGQMGETLTISGAGMAAGMLINPMLAPIGGVVLLTRQFSKVDRMGDTIKRAQQTGLKAEAIAPGTSMSGNVFLPATRDQSALIVFYELNGQTHTLTVPRTSS